MLPSERKDVNEEPSGWLFELAMLLMKVTAGLLGTFALCFLLKFFIKEGAVAKVIHWLYYFGLYGGLGVGILLLIVVIVWKIFRVNDR